MTDPRKDGDTPLTNALVNSHNLTNYDFKVALITLSRQLERQNAALRNALVRLERTTSHRARFREDGPVAEALVDARAALAESESKP